MVARHISKVMSIIGSFYIAQARTRAYSIKIFMDGRWSMADTKKDSILPIFELVFLILGSGFLIFSFYIFPYIVFDVNYEVPHFVVWLEYWYQMHSDFNSFTAIFLPLFVLSLICFFVARRINRFIETNEKHREPDELTPAERFFSKPHSIFRLVVILVFAYFILFAVAQVIDQILENIFT